MLKRDACGCLPTNRSLDTAGNYSIALALTQSSPKPVSSPLHLSMPFRSLRERLGRCSSLIACSCQKSKTWGACALKPQLLAQRPSLRRWHVQHRTRRTLPSRTPKSSFVWLCADDPLSVTVDDQFGPLGYTSEARGAEMKFSVVHGTESECLPESLAQGHEKRDEFVCPRKKVVQCGARATRCQNARAGKKTAR